MEQAIAAKSYRDTFPYEHRAREAKRALKMGKVPIICERRSGCSLSELSTKKFVVVPTMSVRMFMKVLSERIADEVEQNIYLFLGDSVLMARNITMGDLYRAHKEDDGFIYVTYSNEKSTAARQIGAYHSTHSEAERRTAAWSVMQAGQLPIIVEKDEDCPLPDLADNTFFVDPDMPTAVFLQLVSTRVSLEVGRRIYLYIRGSVMAKSDRPMRDVYESCKESDGFLLITYSHVAPPETPPPNKSRVAPSSERVPAPRSPRKPNAPTAVSPTRAVSSPRAASNVPYKQARSDAERREEAKKARAMNRIPVICERRHGSSLPSLQNPKFVVPPKMSVGAFVRALGDRVSAEVAQGTYLFIGNNVLVTNQTTMDDLYATNKDVDGLLYVSYDNTNAGAHHMGVYKSTHTEAYRRAEAERSLNLEKIPIIVERAENSCAKEIDQKKFWIPIGMAFREFTHALRQRIAKETDEKVFFFVDGRLVDERRYQTMSAFHEAHKDEDQFVYVTYSSSASATPRADG